MYCCPLWQVSIMPKDPFPEDKNYYVKCPLCQLTLHSCTVRNYAKCPLCQMTIMLNGFMPNDPDPL